MAALLKLQQQGKSLRGMYYALLRLPYYKINKASLEVLVHKTLHYCSLNYHIKLLNNLPIIYHSKAWQKQKSFNDLGYKYVFVQHYQGKIYSNKQFRYLHFGDLVHLLNKNINYNTQRIKNLKK